MRKIRKCGQSAAALLLSGAVAVSGPAFAGAPVSPGGAPPQAAARAMPLLIPVQQTGSPGSSGSGGGGGSGAESSASAPSGPGTASPAAVAAAQAAVTPQATAAISDSVGAAFDSCRNLNAGYQIDCMGQQLREAATQVAPGGAYGEVNRALNDAANKLIEIARRDRDSDQPRVSIQHSGQSGVRSYGAVRNASLAQSRAAASRVLDEVQTVLLRSAGTSGERRAAFQRIAATMESGKVLLRSS